LERRIKWEEVIRRKGRTGWLYGADKGEGEKGLEGGYGAGFRLGKGLFSGEMGTIIVGVTQISTMGNGIISGGKGLSREGWRMGPKV
jgi:hypothetical protein